MINNRRITVPIPDILEEAVEFVRRNSRTKTIIDENGHRIDKPEYPMNAVREAILNTLTHRDYSIYSENTPIRIEMYRDRMEIIKCGGLYGRITIDALGKVRPETRNATLSNMLDLLKITENRYSGIPTTRKECAMQIFQPLCFQLFTVSLKLFSEMVCMKIPLPALHCWNSAQRHEQEMKLPHLSESHVITSFPT